MNKLLLSILLLLLIIPSFGQIPILDHKSLAQQSSKVFFEKNHSNAFTQKDIQAVLQSMQYEINHHLNFQRVIEYGSSIEEYLVKNTNEYYLYHILTAKAYAHLEDILSLKYAINHLRTLEKRESDAFYTLKMEYCLLQLEYQNRFVNNLELVHIYGRYALKILKPQDDYYRILLEAQMSSLEIDNQQLFSERIDVMKSFSIDDSIKFSSIGHQLWYYYKIGQALMHSNYTEKAKYFIDWSIENYKQAKDVNQVFFGHVLICQAKLINTKGQQSNAFELLKEASRYSNHFRIYEELSLLAYQMGQFDESVQYANIGLDELKKDNKIIHQRAYGEILFLKANVLYQGYFQNGKLSKTELEEVKKVLEKSIKAYEEGKILVQHFEKVSLRYNVALINCYAKLRKILGELYLDTPSKENFAAIFEYTERQRMMELLGELQANHLPNSIFENINQHQKEFELLSFKMSTSTTDIHQLEKELFQEASKIEYLNTINIQHFGYQFNQQQYIEYATVTDVKKWLDEETLYVSFDVFAHPEDNQLELNTLAISTEYQHFSSIQQDSILSYITTLQALIKHPLIIQKKRKNEFICYSHQLYNILFAPLENLLDGKKRLIIMLDGHLVQVPLDVLLKHSEINDFHELDYLIKNYETVYHHSATTFLTLQNRLPISSKDLLAFAPTFSERPVESEKAYLYEQNRYNDLSSLPFSKNEVKTIVDIVESNDNSSLLIDKKATKESLLIEMNNQTYQFIHIATHSFADYSLLNLSGITCYNDAQKGELLFAEEIEQININSDLVVLSTCESGVGRYIKGEGRLGIHRSFLKVGTRNTIFSLWKVIDQPTSQLMINFYRFYKNDNKYSTALRQAKLQMLSEPKMANPRYWSAFVLIGQ